jgi:hypothetical protein
VSAVAFRFGRWRGRRRQYRWRGSAAQGGGLYTSGDILRVNGAICKKFGRNRAVYTAKTGSVRFIAEEGQPQLPRGLGLGFELPIPAHPMLEMR